MPVDATLKSDLEFAESSGDWEMAEAILSQMEQPTSAPTPEAVAPADQQPEQTPKQEQDIFAGLPADVISGIEQRIPERTTAPTSASFGGAAGSFGLSPPREFQEGQAKESVLQSRKDAADFERLRISNPFLAETIENLNPAQQAAIGFQSGLRTLGRGAAGLVGQDIEQDPMVKFVLSELEKVSSAFKVGEIAGESAPLLAAAPLTGAGLAVSTTGRALIPAARTVAGRAAGTGVLTSAEGATIAKGKGKEGLDVAKAGAVSGALGLISEIASPAIRSLGDLRTLTSKNRNLLKEPTQKEISKGLESSAPSIDQLKDASREIYKGIDDLGVKLTDESFESLSKKLASGAGKLGFKETKVGKKLTPQSSTIFELVDDLKAGPVGVSDVEDVRRAAQNSASVASRAGNNQDAAINNSIVDGLDDFLSTLNTKNLKGADVNVGGSLNAARKLWGKARKSELLEEAISEASNQASGLENGIRIKFRQILRNKKKKRFFSESELAVMGQVVEGTKGSNLFKRLGKLGFGKGQQTNVLSGLAGAGVGSTTLNTMFGPLGAGIGLVLLPTVGTISKSLAENLTKKNAAFANQLIRAGTDAEDVTKIYLRNTPPNQRNPEDLASIFMREDIKLELVKSDIGVQAAGIAQRNRIQSVAALAAVPIAAEEQ